MDTGGYMANQMDGLIESGLHQFDQFCKDLDIRIEQVIKERGYTWTPEEIVQQYIEMYSKGYYVSHTCKGIIERFKDDLEKATGIKSKFMEAKHTQEIFITYDKLDGEVFCAFTSKSQCEADAIESGCEMKSVRLVSDSDLSENQKLKTLNAELIEALERLSNLAEDGYRLHVSNGCPQELLLEDRQAIDFARKVYQKAKGGE